MTKYNKLLVMSSILATIGIPLFVIDHSNASWEANREAYWGLIAFVCLGIGVVLFSRASYLEDNKSEK